MTQIKLPSDQTPYFTRKLGKRTVYFDSIWTTKAEAIAQRDKKRKQGKPATIVEKKGYVGYGTRVKIFYYVYSAE